MPTGRRLTSSFSCRGGHCGVRWLQASGNGTQEAQEAHESPGFRVPLVILVFRFPSCCSNVKLCPGPDKPHKFLKYFAARAVRRQSALTETANAEYHLPSGAAMNGFQLLRDRAQLSL